MARLLLWLFILSAILVSPAGGKGPDSSIELHPSARFSETIITLTWDSCPGAKGYNVYADFGNGFNCINRQPIRSGTHFSIVKLGPQDTIHEVLKGHFITMYVAAILDKSVETVKSAPVSTSYFDGFDSALTSDRCAAIFAKAICDTARILPMGKSLTKSDFLKIYSSLAQTLSAYYHAKINPDSEGACVPFSNLAALYLTRKGLTCYRAQGNFIDQFHSFNLIVIDNVEYILDFTSDQFIPHTAPVLMPRAWCAVDSTGRPACAPKGTFTPIYRIAQVFSPDKLSFSETMKALKYKAFFDSLTSRE